MADASFDLTLLKGDEAAKVVRAGDELEARVRFCTAEDHAEVSLEWAVEWVAEGKTTDEGRVASGSELLGGATGGEEREVRLRFAIPTDGPITYRGELLSISWRLRVSLDIPWAFDPDTDLDFEVEPALASADAWAASPLPGVERPKKRRRRRREPSTE
jgi:hypothetical protein